MQTQAYWITLRWKRNSRASSGVRSTWFPSAQSSAAQIGFGARPSWRARSRTLPRDDAPVLDILKAARLAFEFQGRRGQGGVPGRRENPVGRTAPAPGGWRGGQEIIARVPGSAPGSALEADCRNPRQTDPLL